MVEESANESNKSAWDRLYRATSNPVWGEEPLAFLESVIEPLGTNLGAGRTFLDAATGEGRNLPFFIDAGNEIYACDASAGALSKLAQRFGNRIKTTQCDLSQTPYPNASFDLILMADVIETLPEAAQVLEEMARVLRPGGKLLCNIPDDTEEIAGEDMVGLGSHTYLYQNNYYYRFYSREQAIGLLEKAGMEVIYAEEHTWSEAPHPEFRSYAHDHRSLVLISRKPMA
ncbi:MAG: class I SAM-dependent methyltransferase [Opitutales bacterium]|nr:class I SAM-dependent methyltransferase [Opitutales bacterium]NRA28144.1 class I SAM-dependent methyltransferase [Opitutales bacterium]